MVDNTKLFLVGVFLTGASLLILALTACASPGSASGSRGGRLSFEQVDIDGDGGISLAEFLEKVPARLRNPDEIFQRLDANGDGKVSREEFAARGTGRGRPG